MVTCTVVRKLIMLPLGLGNIRGGKTRGTWFLVISLVAVYFYEMSLSPEELLKLVYGWGMVPARLWGAVDTGSQAGAPPAIVTVFSSMFLHGGLWHLAGNLIFLWFFAKVIEGSVGTGRMLCLYLVSGIMAALLEAFFKPSSAIPMVGASGAVAGLLGAALVLYPLAMVSIFIPFLFFLGSIRIPMFMFAGLWLLMQVFGLLGSGSDEVGGTAWWAHIGGFGAGFYIAKKRWLPMLIRKLSPVDDDGWIHPSDTDARGPC